MLHFQATQKLLNWFAATGHSNFAKCTQLYLQEMNNLQEQNPWLHEIFLKGFHTVLRLHQNWTSIRTDLAIEQTLMRVVKSRSGLTQVRNFTVNCFLLWAHVGEACLFTQSRDCSKGWPKLHVNKCDETG